MTPLIRRDMDIEVELLQGRWRTVKIVRLGRLLAHIGWEQWWYMASAEVNFWLWADRDEEGRVERSGGLSLELDYYIEDWIFGPGVIFDMEWALAKIKLYLGPFTLKLGWWWHR